MPKRSFDETFDDVKHDMREDFKSVAAGTLSMEECLGKFKRALATKQEVKKSIQGCLI
jgi:hypothetical protein